MLLVIECIILCGIFALCVLPPLYRNPLNCIMSYPTAIRKRVESLPQYHAVFAGYKKKHLAIKALAVLGCVVAMSAVAWFSGAKGFGSAFLHVFIMFFAVNLFDLLVLDMGLFCHDKRMIIPGTEDMLAEYRSYRHHLRGAVIGTAIGTVVALASGGLVALAGYIVR